MKNINHTRSSISDDIRSEERFSRNAETDLVCRLLLAKKSADRQMASGCLEADLRGLGVFGSGVEELSLVEVEHAREDHGLELLGLSGVAQHAVVVVLPRVGDAVLRAGQLLLQVQEVLVRFFFKETPPPEIYTLSLHDALPIYQ